MLGNEGEIPGVEEILKNKPSIKERPYGNKGKWSVDAHWQMLMAKRTQGFEPSLTSKDKGDLKCLEDFVGDNVYDFLNELFADWYTYASAITMEEGLKEVKADPDLGFIVLYREKLYPMVMQSIGNKEKAAELPKLEVDEGENEDYTPEERAELKKKYGIIV
jgi:hypothetical protein